MKAKKMMPDVKSMSKPAPKTEWTAHSDATRRDCYVSCIDDAYELKSEFVCASACGV